MLKRFSVSLDENLLSRFDGYLDTRGYANRSEAIRDLIRKVLIGEEWERDRITELQHAFHHQITSTTHVHMDHDNCLEVTIVKGRASQVKELADQLIALRGVKDGSLTMSSTGDRLD